MRIEQIYTKCLAQGAYYIESDGEVAVIDPLRETFPYIDRAKNDGAEIKYIFETHFHADFVSGHLDLSKSTDAKIVFGPEAKPSFKFHSATDGEVFNIGSLTITVIHTPGHTMESSCYLLKDSTGKQLALFTGDTLFIGDVGRPDLAQKSEDMTKEDLAGMLFDSLRTKLLPLDDQLIVYPGHGAGSACGKNMSKETFSTLGEQKKNNYAFDSKLSKSDFINQLIDGLLPPPGYFGLNVALNKSGSDNIDQVIKKGLTPLNINSFKKLTEDKEVLVLDTRTASDFAKGHFPGSLFVGLEGQFAPWVGAVISDIKQKLVLITPIGKEEETVRRLSRVGYDQVMGYLKGGFQEWSGNYKAIESVNRINVTDLLDVDFSSTKIVDVRKPGEYEASHINDAILLPLDFITKNINEYPNTPFILHCAGGYRSMIASSILKINGIHDIMDVIGGFNAIPENAQITSTFVCPNGG
ncbi:MBL fold metallo-hydrolase [Crocinitomicaceae bacterium]|nr:MBL fold metallo-hydrolase [Crocinitomicaceae bacterium]